MFGLEWHIAQLHRWTLGSIGTLLDIAEERNRPDATQQANAASQQAAEEQRRIWTSRQDA